MTNFDFWENCEAEIVQKIVSQTKQEEKRGVAEGAEAAVESGTRKPETKIEETEIVKKSLCVFGIVEI